MNFKTLLALCALLAISTVGSAVSVSHTFPTAKKTFKGDEDGARVLQNGGDEDGRRVLQKKKAK